MMQHIQPQMMTQPTIFEVNVINNLNAEFIWAKIKPENGDKAIGLPNPLLNTLMQPMMQPLLQPPFQAAVNPVIQPNPRYYNQTRRDSVMNPMNPIPSEPITVIPAQVPIQAAVNPMSPPNPRYYNQTRRDSAMNPMNPMPPHKITPVGAVPPIIQAALNQMTQPNSRYYNQTRRDSAMNPMNPNPSEPITVIPAQVIPPRAHVDSAKTNIFSGFVRIAPSQSLPMPVVLQNPMHNMHLAFVTLFVEDTANNQQICIAHNLQINRRNIEVRRSENGEIGINQTDINAIDQILLSWSLPQFLCNSMKNHGWDNISLWHQITESDLVNMGFHRGHRLVFFDKSTDLLRNHRTLSTSTSTEALHIKYVLSAWKLPLCLSSKMAEQGWTDPYDWALITDLHFKKMGFEDGHIASFLRHIQNNDHIALYHKMQNESKAEVTMAPAPPAPTNGIMPNRFIPATFPEPIPILSVEPTTITHEQFWYKLVEMRPNEIYVLEIKSGNEAWMDREDIPDMKRRNICELDMDTSFFVRIRSENKLNNKVRYSEITAVKTEDEQWKNTHLPRIPDFKYAVSSNNKQITVEFDEKSLEQIKQTKFDERYSLDIGLCKESGDGTEKQKINWKNVATVRKDKLVYKYNVNDQKNADSVHVGISARNDLGQRYNQCTRTRQFPFNQVIKRINTTKHGNNLQFNESMTVATKIDQDYRYSTFAFGQPITNEMCNRYDMYVKVNKLKTDCFMGYAPSVESVVNWNQALGYGSNKNGSVGVLANKSSADFAVYNKDVADEFIYHAASARKERKWDDGSIFILSFDFRNDVCNIYLNENNETDNNDHNTLDNNKLIKSMKLNQAKSVIPSFSLNSEGDSIEVVKWRLY